DNTTCCFRFPTSTSSSRSQPSSESSSDGTRRHCCPFSVAPRSNHWPRSAAILVTSVARSGHSQSCTHGREPFSGIHTFISSFQEAASHPMERGSLHVVVEALVNHI